MSSEDHTKPAPHHQPVAGEGLTPDQLDAMLSAHPTAVMTFLNMLPKRYFLDRRREEEKARGRLYSVIKLGIGLVPTIGAAVVYGSPQVVAATAFLAAVTLGAYDAVRLFFEREDEQRRALARLKQENDERAIAEYKERRESVKQLLGLGEYEVIHEHYKLTFWNPSDKTDIVIVERGHYDWAVRKADNKSETLENYFGVGAAFHVKKFIERYSTPLVPPAPPSLRRPTAP